MSTSLDKLKALSNKLEERIEKKQGTQSTMSLLDIAEETPQPARKKSTKPIQKVVPIEDTAQGNVRESNIKRVEALYNTLEIFQKSPDFDNIFAYKAMNLSGIGLKEDDFGEVREGKYIQIIAITYEPDKNGKKKAKNISLGYFGKAEALEEKRKNEIIEFVLRWRYEKAFQNVEHYKDLLARVKSPDTLF